MSASNQPNDYIERVEGDFDCFAEESFTCQMSQKNAVGDWVEDAGSG